MLVQDPIKKLSQEKRDELDANIREMIKNGASEDDVIQYASDFREKYATSEKKKEEQQQNIPEVSETTDLASSEPKQNGSLVSEKQVSSGAPTVENQKVQQDNLLEEIYSENTELQRQGNKFKPQEKDIFESASEEDLKLVEEYEGLKNLTEEEGKEITDKIAKEESGSFGFFKTAQNFFRLSPIIGKVQNPFFDPSQMAEVSDLDEAKEAKIKEKQQEFIRNLGKGKQEKIKELISVKNFRAESKFNAVTNTVNKINDSLIALDGDFEKIANERRAIKNRVDEITVEVKQNGATNALRNEYDNLLKQDQSVVNQGNSLLDNANNLVVERDDELNALEESADNIGSIEQEIEMLKKNYGFLDNVKDRVLIGFAEIGANAKSLIERTELKRERRALKSILQYNDPNNELYSNDVPAKYKVDGYKFNEAEYDKETEQLINRSYNSAFIDRAFAERARETLRPKIAVEDINSFSDVIDFTIDGLAENASTLTQLAVPYVGQTMFLIGQKEGNEIQLRKERADNQKSFAEITKQLEAEGLSEEDRSELTKEKADTTSKLYKQNDLSDSHYFWASTGMAVSELMFSRMFGEVKRINIGKRILSQAGKQTLKREVKRNVVDQLKYTSKNVFKGGWEVAKDGAEEGFLDEFLTNTTQNGIKMFALGDDSVNLFDNSMEAIGGGLSVGTVMSLAPRVAGQFISHFSDKKRRTKVYNNVTQITAFQKYLDENPSLNKKEIERIEGKIDGLLKDNKTIIKATAETFDNLSKQEKEALLDASTKMTALEIAVDKIDAKKIITQEDDQLRKGFIEEIEALDNEKKAILDSEGKTETTEEDDNKINAQTTKFANEIAENEDDIEDISDVTAGSVKVTVGDSSVNINSNGDTIVIESISTKEGKRGKGSAKNALAKVVEIADKQDKTLELNVSPLDDTTDAEGLIKLYESQGFVKEEGFKKDGGKMVRQPNQTQTFADIVAKEKQKANAPQEETVGQAINRPVTLTELGGSKLETAVEGDMYVEGQTVVVEDAEGNIYEVGNVDDLSDQKIADLGIEHKTDSFEITKEGKVNVDGKDWNVQLDLPTQGIEYDQNGNITNVSLKDDSGKTVKLEGQQAVDIGYKVLLKNAEEDAQINEKLGNNEDFKNELRKTKRTPKKETNKNTQPVTKTKTEKVTEPKDKAKTQKEYEQRVTEKTSKAKDGTKAEPIKVKVFKKGDGGTLGVFEGEDGKLYKSVTPTEREFDGKKVTFKKLDIETEEHKYLSENQDLKHLPKVGKIVETSEGRAFEIEKLNEVEEGSLTLEEINQIDATIKELNDRDIAINDLNTVMRRDNGEIVLIDLSTASKNSFKDSETVSSNVVDLLNKNDLNTYTAVASSNNKRTTVRSIEGDKTEFTYLMTARPPSIGTHPLGQIKDAEEIKIGNRTAYRITYKKPLSKEEVNKYELVEEMTTLDMGRIFKKGNALYIIENAGDIGDNTVTVSTNFNGKAITKDMTQKGVRNLLKDAVEITETDQKLYGSTKKIVEAQKAEKKAKDKAKAKEVKKETPKKETAKVYKSKGRSFVAKFVGGKLVITPKFGTKKATETQKTDVTNQYIKDTDFTKGKKASVEGKGALTPEQVAQVVVEESQNPQEVAEAILVEQKIISEQGTDPTITKEEAIAQALLKVRISKQDAGVGDISYAYTTGKSKKKVNSLDQIVEEAQSIFNQENIREIDAIDATLAGFDSDTVISKGDIEDFMQSYKSSTDFNSQNKTPNNLVLELSEKFESLTGLQPTQQNIENVAGETTAEQKQETKAKKDTTKSKAKSKKAKYVTLDELMDKFKGWDARLIGLKNKLKGAKYRVIDVLTTEGEVVIEYVLPDGSKSNFGLPINNAVIIEGFASKFESEINAFQKELNTPIKEENTIDEVVPDEISDEDVPFQTESEQVKIKGKALQAIVDVLKKTGLAKAVKIFNNTQINDVLKKLGVNERVLKQEPIVESKEKWIGDRKVLSGPSIQEAKTGEPVVVKAYHGTTHEFYEFDADVNGTVQGHLGKVNYFTSDKGDASQNYQSSGPDLTLRTESRKERLADELQDIHDIPTYLESGAEYLSKEEKDILIDNYGLTLEEINEARLSEIPDLIANKELNGGNDTVLDVNIRMDNPVVIGRGRSWVEVMPKELYEDSIEDATEEIAEENDITIEEAKEDYQWEIEERAMEIEGVENPFIEALQDAINENTYSGDVNGKMATEILSDFVYEAEVDLNQLEKSLREELAFAQNEDGELSSSQIISDFFQNLGYDGIIINNPDQRFKNMGIGSGTSHIHVFNQHSNNIKLDDGTNTTFNEDTKDIRFQKELANKGITPLVAPTWKSTAKEGIKKLPNNPRTAEQWTKAIAEKGGKGTAQELEWIGLNDFLVDYQKSNNLKSVPKEVVEQYIDDNQIEIVEITKGRNSEIRSKEIRAEFEKQGYEIEIQYDYIIFLKGEEILEDPEAELPKDLMMLGKEFYSLNNVDGSISPDNSKYAQYQLEGGDNYREVLLRLPNLETLEEYSLRNYNLKLSQLSEEELENIKFDFERDNVGAYKSSHWDESNILAHVRMNERTLPNGERVLFIEEMQSDWAQQGKKEGFVNKEAEKTLSKAKEDVKKANDAVIRLDAFERETETLMDIKTKVFREKYTWSTDENGKIIIHPSINELGLPMGEVGDRKVVYDSQQNAYQIKGKDYKNGNLFYGSKELAEKNLKGKANERVWFTKKTVELSEIPKEMQDVARYLENWARERDKIEEPIKEAVKNGLITLDKYSHNTSRLDKYIPTKEVLDDANGVANMPYKKTDQWVGMAMRRVMQMASQEGFDRVAWVTGEQSADRYDLSKQVDKIEYKKNSDGTFRVTAIKNGNVITNKQDQTLQDIEGLLGKEIAKKIENNTSSENIENNEKREEELYNRKRKIYEDIDSGKVERKDVISEIEEISKEQIELDKNSNEGELSGLDLEVGGEGMKTFYNSILPKVAKKEAQRFDKSAKVDVIDFSKPKRVATVKFEKKTPLELFKKEDVDGLGFRYTSKQNDTKYLVVKKGNIARVVGLGNARKGKDVEFNTTKEAVDYVENLINETEEGFERYYGVDENGKTIENSGATTKELAQKKADRRLNNLTKDNEEKQAEKQLSIALTDKTNEAFTEAIPLFQKTDGNEEIINGFVHDANVYLNSDNVKADTPIHEFGHLWIGHIEKNHKEVYDTGMKLIEDSIYHKKVQNNPAYSGLSPKAQLEEALAQAIGESGVELQHESTKKYDQFKSWFKKLFTEIANGLGIRNMTGSQLANLSLKDFTRRAGADLLAGNKIGEFDTKQPKAKIDTSENTGIDFLMAQQTAVFDAKNKLVEAINHKKVEEKDVKKAFLDYLNQTIKRKGLSEIQSGQLTSLLKLYDNTVTERKLDIAIKRIDEISQKLDQQEYKTHLGKLKSRAIAVEKARNKNKWKGEKRKAIKDYLKQTVKDKEYFTTATYNDIIAINNAIDTNNFDKAIEAIDKVAVRLEKKYDIVVARNETKKRIAEEKLDNLRQKIKDEKNKFKDQKQNFADKRAEVLEVKKAILDYINDSFDNNLLGKIEKSQFKGITKQTKIEDIEQLQDSLNEIDDIVLTLQNKKLDDKVKSLLNKRKDKKQSGKVVAKQGGISQERATALNEIAKNIVTAKSKTKAGRETILKDKLNEISDQITEIITVEGKDGARIPVPPENISEKDANMVDALLIAEKIILAELQTDPAIENMILEDVVEKLEHIVKTGKHELAIERELQNIKLEYEQDVIVPELDGNNSRTSKGFNDTIDNIKRKYNKRSALKGGIVVKRIAQWFLRPLYSNLTTLRKKLSKNPIVGTSIQGFQRLVVDIDFAEINMNQINHNWATEINDMKSKIFKGFIPSKEVRLINGKVKTKKVNIGARTKADWALSEPIKITIETPTGKARESFSASVLLDVWLKAKDPSNLDGLAKTGFTAETIAEIDSKLSDNVKQYGEALMDFYRSKHKEVNEVYRKMYYRDLPFNEFYSGKLNISGVVEEVEQSMLEQVHSHGTTAGGSLKSRTNHNKPITPSNVDVNVGNYITQMSKFIAYAEVHRRLNKTLNNEDFKKVVYMNNKDGGDLLDQLTMFKKRHIEKTKAHEVSKVINMINRNYVTFTLGGKLKQIPIQMVSAINGQFSLPKGLTAKEWAIAHANIPKDMLYLLEHSKLIKQRLNTKQAIKAFSSIDDSYSYTNNMTSNDRVNLMFRLLGDVADRARTAGMTPIKVGDMMGVSGQIPVFGASKIKIKQENPSWSDEKVAQEAMMVFEDSVNRTQQGQTKGVKSFVQNHPLLKLMINFKTTPILNINESWIALNDLRKGGKASKGKVHNILTLINYGLLQNSIYTLVNTASTASKVSILYGTWELAKALFDDEDDEEQLKGFSDVEKDLLFSFLGGQFVDGMYFGMLKAFVDLGILGKEHTFGTTLPIVVKEEMDKLDVNWKTYITTKNPTIKRKAGVKVITSFVSVLSGLPPKAILEYLQYYSIVNGTNVFNEEEKTKLRAGYSFSSVNNSRQERTGITLTELMETSAVIGKVEFTEEEIKKAEEKAKFNKTKEDAKSKIRAGKSYTEEELEALGITEKWQEDNHNLNKIRVERNHAMRQIKAGKILLEEDELKRLNITEKWQNDNYPNWTVEE